MNTTSLHAAHIAAGATMVPYAGWDMPVSYAGTVSEIEAVRARCGIFDVSHMGEVRVKGPGAFDFLQSIATNDLSRVGPGQAQYSLLLNPNGGVIDDIIIYVFAANDYMVVVNAGCKDKDWDWISDRAKSVAGVQVFDESDITGLLAVQGPNARAIVNGLSQSKTTLAMKRFSLRQELIAGISVVMSRTGYTGEDGFELFCAWDQAPALWDAIVAAGSTPAGLGARDVLRLEAAYPLYGHELQAEVSPLESGAGWAVKTAKGDFVGSAAVRRVKSTGIQSKLVGVKMNERSIPRENFNVQTPDGEPIGIVTSGTYSPTVKSGIALARISAKYAPTGTPVVIDIRGRKCAGTVVDLPFYRNGV